MSLRPTAIVQEQGGAKGLYVAIVDPDTTGVLLLPCSFEHRRVVTRVELEDGFELHPARVTQPKHTHLSGDGERLKKIAGKVERYMWRDSVPIHRPEFADDAAFLRDLATRLSPERDEALLRAEIEGLERLADDYMGGDPKQMLRASVARLREIVAPESRSPENSSSEEGGQHGH